MSETMPTAPLCELADITMGQSPNSADVNENERGLPFLQGCAEFGPRNPTANIHCSPPLRIAQEGSTLISVRAPVGTTNRADQKYSIGRGLGAVSAKHGKADNVFLLHAINHSLSFLHRRSQGSTFLAIRSSDLQEMPVPSPGLPQQQRIAEILSTVDEAIEQTEALIAKTQAIKAGLMHDLFTRGIAKDGQLRPPQEEAPQLYKQSPLGWIPNDWKVDPLQKLCGADITYGIVQAGPHVDGGVPYVRTGDMSGNELKRDSLQCTSPQLARSYLRSRVRTGEIVCAIRATVGKVLPVPPDLDGANLTQGTARISPKPTAIDPTFLLWVLRADRVQSAVSAQVKGTTFSEITLANLRRIPIANPRDIGEQKAIAEALQESLKQIELETIKKNKLCHVKRGLMHDLLTGDVLVDFKHFKEKTS